MHSHSHSPSDSSAKNVSHGSPTFTNDFVTSNDFVNNDTKVKYCASQFYSYSKNELSRLEKSTLHALLSSETLGIASEDELFETLIELGTDYYEYWRYIKVFFLSSEGISKFVQTLPFDEIGLEIWDEICHRLKNEYEGEDVIRDVRFVLKSTSTSTSTSTFSSKILMTFPTVLSELKSKQWRLLYRGSDHGFGGSDFHAKCDGISNTVTIILTTEGFIFGGFTPLAWDSSNQWKPDTSGQSFVFSVKNPHNRDFGRLGLKNPQYAIYCYAPYGPTFGSGHTIHVANCCNANTGSYTRLGYGYVNNTGINEYQVFTGAQSFTVKEIEVFTLTD
jgi:hypothetical protein